MREKVLIIESNRPLAGVWQAYLVKHGFDAVCAIDGESNKALASWGFPDVIVSGLDFAKAIPSGADYCIKALGIKPLHGNLIPVVQLSNTPLPKSVKNSLEGSAFRLIEKPLPLQSLLDCVREAAFEAQAASLRRAGAATMSANLHEHSLAGMLQAIDSGSKSGTAIVSSQAGKACFRFHKALLVEAKCGNLSGSEAVIEALTWNEGMAAFHEGPIHVQANGSAPVMDIQNLIGEALRQREIIERASRMLSIPTATLKRNPSAKIGGKAPFSERIFIALETPCDATTLAERLKSLSRRQMLIAVEGMLERGELTLSTNSSQRKLDDHSRKALIETLLDKSACEKAIATPPAIAVSALNPRLTKRFIGAASGVPFASAALINAGRLHVLLCEIPAEELHADALPAGGLLLLFDRLESASVAKVRKLAKRLGSEKSAQILIASVTTPEHMRMTTSTTELLGLDDSCAPVNFDFTRESCAATIAELLKRNS